MSTAHTTVDDKSLTTPAETTPTYGRIIKSTTLVGGSSMLNIVFGIVRSKAIAVLLGPAGVGLMGLYNSVVDITYSLSGLGLQNSGVRQIAEAVGSGDAERIARTATVLRRVSLLSGLLGALVLIGLARPVSYLTFESYEQTTGVALLGLAVFCRSVSAGQSALLQGLRRIGDLARMTVIAAAASTTISIPMVYLFGTQGVVPSLIAVAGVTVVTSWYYSRQVGIGPAPVSIGEIGHEATALLRLGIAFMVSGLLSMGAAYAIRIVVNRDAGLEAAGMYQAAWTIGGLYIGVILQAMGTDFYPRLTAVAEDNEACNRLVNEQALISFLLAGPGVLATLTFAPLVIALFYSSAFFAAVDILRWICLGMMLRVLSWPMGFIVVAKGRQQIMIWTEVAATAVHVGLAWVFVKTVGIQGAGAAFFCLYIWHGALIYVIVRRISGFRWSETNVTVGRIFFPLTAVVFGGFFLLPFWAAFTLGAVATAASAWYSLRTLLTLVPLTAIPAKLRPVFSRIAAFTLR